MLDIFKSNPAFGVIPLTDAINNVKFVPGRVGSMGLFSASSIATTAIAIEEKDGILTLVSPSPRGGPGQTVEKTGRRLRMLSVPHFEINDAVMAEEVQGVRAWGSETNVEQLMEKLAERGRIHSQSMAITEEHARVGAIKGVITYANGQTTNLFTEFGVNQEIEADWDLDNANPTAGVLRKKCAGLYRQMAAILDGLPFSGIHAFCGDAFFDDLIAHKETRETYQEQEAAALRAGYVSNGASGSYGIFDFGGIRFENYRGYFSGTPFIGTDAVHFFPVGVPGLFRTVYAPADYNETVNTMGRRLYVKQWAMPNDKGINLDTQMNALSYCTRPKVLIKGKRS